MVNPLLNSQNKDVLKSLGSFDLLLFKTFQKVTPHVTLWTGPSSGQVCHCQTRKG